MTIKNEKISIVLPIYSVEEYLPRCLDTIIGQTYTNIEILLVDDGSPDGSGVICDKYAEQDQRIRVFHIPNGGVAKARQHGVEKSTGEYIVFVDPDDWMTPDAVETLYKQMDDDISIVISSYTRVFEGKHLDYVSKYEVCDQEMYIKKLLGYKILVAPWAKLYRRNLFGDDSFPAYKRNQDTLMNIKMSLLVNKVKFIENVTYYYLYSRPDSTSNKTIMPFEEKMSMIDYVYSSFNIGNATDKYELYLAIFSLNFIFTDVRDGRFVDVNNVKVNNILSILDKHKLPLTNKVMVIVLKSRLLQKVYYLFRKSIASNMLIRKLMAKIR